MRKSFVAQFWFVWHHVPTPAVLSSPFTSSCSGLLQVVNFFPISLLQSLATPEFTVGSSHLWTCAHVAFVTGSSQPRPLRSSVSDVLVVHTLVSLSGAPHDTDANIAPSLNFRFSSLTRASQRSNSFYFDQIQFINFLSSIHHILTSHLKRSLCFIQDHIFLCMFFIIHFESIFLQGMRLNKAETLFF